MKEYDIISQKCIICGVYSDYSLRSNVNKRHVMLWVLEYQQQP